MTITVPGGGGSSASATSMPPHSSSSSAAAQHSSSSSSGTVGGDRNLGLFDINKYYLEHNLQHFVFNAFFTPEDLIFQIHHRSKVGYTDNRVGAG